MKHLIFWIVLIVVGGILSAIYGKSSINWITEPSTAPFYVNLVFTYILIRMLYGTIEALLHKILGG